MFDWGESDGGIGPVLELVAVYGLREYCLIVRGFMQWD